nr:hypothetical protein [Desulfolutivibrio sulfoxidireducens]
MLQRKGKSQHVLELDSILEKGFRVVLEKKIRVDTRDSESLALIKGQLITKRSRADIKAMCAFVPVNRNDMPEERRSDAFVLAGWFYGDIHDLMCFVRNLTDDAYPDNGVIRTGGEAP